MKQSFILCLLFIAVVFNTQGLISGEKNGNEPKPVMQKKEVLKTLVEVKLNYLLYLPENYDQKESWPVLLFLHGSGERGDDLEKVKIHGPPMLIEQGKEFPFIVVSPQCPKGYWWEPIELIALLDEISCKYKVDQNRICVTGLSMGGFGSWRLAHFAPDRLAAIAPVCGGGETYWTERFAHLAVWAFHGAKDFGVPMQRSQVMIDALIKDKAEPAPKLTIYPEAGHNSWTETYDNPELYKWFLKQKRRDKPIDSETKK